ncbi:MAG: hypothetical protein ACYCPT_13025 [Acidimicrobiales bacterium]
MAQIFIANPTLQHRDLHVRVGPKQTRIVSIPARGQAMFPDDLDGEKLGQVVAQIERAGAVPQNDPKAIQHRFSLLYSVSESKSKPIPASKIETAGEVDESVRQKLSGDMLERSGVAAFKNAAQVGAREISMEITETNDQAPVRGGVDVEVIVSPKRGVRGSAVSKKR